MFVDEIKVYARAGHGGRGAVAFRREAYIAKGGPDAAKWKGVDQILQKAKIPGVPKADVAVFVGTVTHMDVVWTFADVMNALMAVPNLVALLALSGVCRFETVRELVTAHPGKCPLFLCFMRPTGQVIFVEPNDRYFVTPSRQLQQRADELFGEETYYVKVDTTLPEKQQRWAKRTEFGSGEE